MVKKNLKEVVSQVDKKIIGITKGWRIVGNKKVEQHQTVILVINEISAQKLQSRGWRVSGSK